MSNVDDRIVSMTFDNENFERRISSTLDALDKLSQSLKFAGASQGFNEVSAAADHMNLSNVASSVENISNKFSAMGVVAFSVIQKITSSALDFAQRVGGDILGPILSGGKNRAANIQQAQFMFRGIGIDVEAGMQSALDAVRGTAYGLDEAAKIAAQFGASGIEAGDQMTSALRGVAGAAAMTGSSFSEIGDIFAQSAALGEVNNQDLQQFATRGLNAASAIGKVMGKTEAEIHEMATNGQLDFKTFSDAMNQAFGAHATEANQLYSGSVANLHAAMSRLGASFIGPQLLQQRDIFNALSPVIDSVSKALKPLIDEFNNLRQIATTKIVSFLNNVNDSLNAFSLRNIAASIPNFAEALRNSFIGITQFLDAIKQALKNVFPPSVLPFWFRFSELVKDLTEHLKMGGDTLTKIKFVFEGFFSIIRVGFIVIQSFSRMFKHLFEDMAPVSGGILDLVAHLGQLVRWYTTVLINSGKIQKFFFILETAIRSVIGVIIALKDKFIEFWDSFKDSGKVGTNFGDIESRLNHLTSLPDKVTSAWQRMQDRFQGVFAVLDDVLAQMKEWFGKLGANIASAFGPGSFDQAVDAVNVGLIGGIFLIVKRFLQGGGLGDALTGGIGARLKGIFNNVNVGLQTMQTNLKADILDKLARAIAILTASLVILSLIDSAALTKALVAVSAGFAELIGSMKLLESVDAKGGKIATLAFSMELMASAVLILAGAIAIVAHLKPEELARGLQGVGASVGLFILVFKLLGDDISGTVSAAFSMNLMATSLVILAGAVKLFSLLGWAELAKGMTAVAVGLGIIAIAMNSMPPSSVLSGAGLIEVAIGLNILAGAVKLFSLLGWAELAKGMVGITASLLILTAAMDSMPLSTAIKAAGLVILAGALTTLAGVVKLMGSMDLGELAKGIGAITALLLVLGIAMATMEGALPGAASLVIIGFALSTFADVLEQLAKLSIAEIVTGLLAIVAVLGIVAGASILLSESIPFILGLGIALSAVGAGFALFGAGAYLVAAAFEKIAESGVAGMKAFIEMGKILISSTPEFVKFLVQTIVGAISDILNSVPLLVKLIVAVLDSLLDAVIKLSPKLAQAISVLIVELLTRLREEFPEFVKTGIEMILSLLKGIKENIGEITKLAVDIVTNFLDALRDKVPEIVESVFELFKTIIVEVARKTAESVPELVVEVGIAIMEGFLKGLESSYGKVHDFFVELPGKILSIIKHLLGIESPSTVFMDIGVQILTGLLNGLITAVSLIFDWFVKLPVNILLWIGNMELTLLKSGIDLLTGFYTGILSAAWAVVQWFVGLPASIVEWIGNVLYTLEGIGLDLLGGLVKGLELEVITIKNFFTGFKDKVLEWIGDGLDWLHDLAVNVIVGFWRGLESMKDWFVEKAKDIAGWITNPIGKVMDMFSPSRVMMRMGVHVIEGLAIGMESMRSSVENLSSSISGTIIDNMNSDKLSKTMNLAFDKIVSQLGDMKDFAPTITPVLDLSKVQAASGNISGMLGTQSISPDFSIGSANMLASLIDTNKAVTDQSQTPTTQEVNFTQNNYSPEPLSAIDIYRNTNSQIALAKEELGIK